MQFALQSESVPYRQTFRCKSDIQKQVVFIKERGTEIQKFDTREHFSITQAAIWFSSVFTFFVNGKCKHQYLNDISKM